MSRGLLHDSCSFTDSLIFYCQEAANAAWEEAEKEQDSSSESSSSSSSCSDNSSSDFGLKAGEKKSKAKAKAKPRQKKPKQEAEHSEANGQAPSGLPSNSSQAGADSSKPEKPAGVPDKLTASALQEKGQSSLKSLQEANALAIWSGLKSKDVDSRINKALDLISKMDNRPGDANLATLSSQLSQEVDRVSSEIAIFQNLSSNSGKSDNIDLLLQHGQTIANYVSNWSFEHITSFLTDTGRKLCDNFTAHVNAQAGAAFFFFLSVKKFDKWNGFSLHLLKDIASANNGASEMCVHLAQIQQNLINYFLDRFRSMPAESVEPVLKGIPLEFSLPQICRTNDRSIVHCRVIESFVCNCHQSLSLSVSSFMIHDLEFVVVLTFAFVDDSDKFTPHFRHK